MYAHIEWEGERCNPVIVLSPRNEGEELTLSLLAGHKNFELRLELPTAEEMVKRYLVPDEEEGD